MLLRITGILALVLVAGALVIAGFSKNKSSRQKFAHNLRPDSAMFSSLETKPTASASLSPSVSGTPPGAPPAKLRVALICIETRNLGQMLTFHQKSLGEYAAFHGYDYKFFSDYKHAVQLPVYWWKMQALQQLLASGAYDVVMWFDSDTIVGEPQVPLEDLLALTPAASIYIGRDFPAHADDSFCAGVFAVRATPEGKKFIAACLDHYLQNPRCRSDNGQLALNGNWAGECYEQGVMNQILRTTPPGVLSDWPISIVCNTVDSVKRLGLSVFVHHYGQDKEVTGQAFRTFFTQQPSLPARFSTPPPQTCLIITMYAEPARLAQYQQIVHQYLIMSGFPLIWVVDSAGAFSPLEPNPRLKVFSFRQPPEQATQGPSLGEKNALLRFWDVHEQDFFETHQFLCKVTGKYFLPHLEKALMTVPANVDLVVQHRTDCWGQNCELVALKPELMRSLLDSISPRCSFERAVKKLASHSPKVARFPPFLIPGNTWARSDGSTLKSL